METQGIVGYKYGYKKAEVLYAELQLLSISTCPLAALDKPHIIHFAIMITYGMIIAQYGL